MQDIKVYLTAHHRHCDELFAAVERTINDGDWDGAALSFARFQAEMEGHFEVEEQILFPAFEARTGMTMGPTQVMRGEHAQMRELLRLALAGIERRNADDCLGYAETLLIMAQQHNMKEENVLYPMCDQHLSEQSPDLLDRMSLTLEK